MRGCLQDFIYAETDYKMDTEITSNHSGSSGGIEVQGVVDMFQHSQATYDIRYKNYLGDGDNASYPTVVAVEPYGPNFLVEKLKNV